MYREKIIIFLSFVFSLILISCAASTGSRYKTTKKKEKKIITKKELPPENFDISAYRTKLDIKGKKIVRFAAPSDTWYEYKTKVDTGTIQSKYVGKTAGFRVQVYSTDNLSAADSIKSAIYKHTNQKSVYIDFEPPFYKVKVGDFTNYNDAKNLSFKLSQIGYPDARVVNDSVNVFK